MPRPRVVAIHQPNFLPWLGYFDKIVRADVFIFMDNAQFPKTGGTWTNRVKLRIGGQPTWVTVPVVRAYHGTRLIREMQIDNTIPWRDRLLSAIRFNYARAPYFNAVYPLVTEWVKAASDSLSEFNVTTVRALAGALQLDQSKCVMGSTLNAGGKATDLLIAMTRAVGGTAYLCGGGASGYQEDDKFAAAGVGLIYQDYRHPVYPQGQAAEFIPGLSIIDALMHCGVEGTGTLLKGR
jgi:WbqC-like protein family